MSAAITVADASAEARRIPWASSTLSVGILISRNGREMVWHFDRFGRAVAIERDGGRRLSPMFEPWSAARCAGEVAL